MNFDSLKFDTSENTCQSLRLLAEKARVSDVRCDGAELQPGKVRDYLTITISVQKVR